MSGSVPREESSGDKSLRRALQPLVEESIRISIRKDPRILADALFPAIGAAVSKAVSAALATLVQTINQTLDNSFSVRALQWRFEALRTGRPFGEIVLARSLHYRVEQAFLIHKRTGILLRHEAAAAVKTQDADMVSGMLSAIEDFVRDSFGEGESTGLDTIQVGDLHVWIQHGPTALLACVVRGIAPRRLAAVFQGAIERIHAAMASDLQKFHGDTAPFEECSADVKACLLGQLDDVAKIGFKGTLILAVALAVALAALAAWRWRVRSNWRDFVDSLRAAEGIVVISDDVGWRTFRISGLRDPAAPDPQPLLQNFGIPPDRVEMRWAPYLSLDPALVAARRLNEIRAALSRYRIPFSFGGSDLIPGVVDPVCADVRALLELERQTGASLKVVVQGRSDGTGQQQMNADLARDRARNVMAELVAQGIPQSKLAFETKLGTARTVILRVEDAR